MEIEYDPILRKYYEEYLEFDSYLEFRIVNYEKFFPKTKRNVMFSKFAGNYEEVCAILSKYGNDKKYNVYVSSNTRPEKTKTDEGVVFRRTFYIDVEADGEKPPYEDKEYYRKLLNTAKYIWGCLIFEGIQPNRR